MATPFSISPSDRNDRKSFFVSQAKPRLNAFQNTMNNTPKFSTLVTNSLSQTTSKLGNFRTALENLKSADNYTNTLASVHYGSSVSVRSTGANSGTHTVKVEQMATRHTVSSDSVAETDAALGKQGTIYLNKTAISIQSTDSLTDIMQKINYGEDTDHNGKLGVAEDQNNNGTIDIIAGIASQPGFTEDANGNGSLDASEDINNNKKLDGGTQEHRVKASIQDNKLVLQLDHTGKDEIKITDDNQVMESLGVISLNSKNETSFKNTIQSAQQAKITLDGKNYSSDSNTFSDIVANLDITLEQSDSAAVDIKISASTTELVQHVKDVVSAVNSLMSDLKTTLPTKGYSVSNPANQLQKELSRTLSEMQTSSKAAETNSNLKNISDLGISLDQNGTLTLEEAKLIKIATDDLKSVKDILTNPKQGLVPKLSEFASKQLEKSGSLTIAKQVVTSFLDQYNAFPYNSRVQMEIYSAHNQRATQRELFNRDV